MSVTEELYRSYPMKDWYELLRRKEDKSSKRKEDEISLDDDTNIDLDLNNNNKEKTIKSSSQIKIPKLMVSLQRNILNDEIITERSKKKNE